MFMIQSHYLKQLIIILGKELHSRIDAGLPKIMEMFHETRPWHWSYFQDSLTVTISAEYANQRDLSAQVDEH